MNDEPIIVNPSALPALGGMLVRYASALLCGWLIRKGIVTDNDAALVEGLVLTAATIGYAGWRVYAKKIEMVILARAAPDHVAIVSQPSPPPSVEPNA